jgi:flagellin
MEWSPLSLTIIGMSGANTLTQESSQATIGMVKNALDIISETRSTFGSYQNRFEHTIKNLDNTVENAQAAESLIRDTEMAQETVKNAKENILEQVGHSLLAQANQSAENVLSLLK